MNRPRGGNSSSIVTRTRLDATPGKVWDHLLFFEEIGGRPPALLTFLLPEPLRAEGPRRGVGDVTRCIYRTGYLIKKITAIEPQCHLDFDVVEQQLAVGRGIRLEGGSYRLVGLPGGATRVEIETRYRRPGWTQALSRPFEIAAGHAFHHHLLGALRRAVEAPRARSS